MLTLPKPIDIDTFNDEDEPLHYSCGECYPDPFASRAYCGMLLSREVGDEEAEASVECEICAATDYCPECGS